MPVRSRISISGFSEEEVTEHLPSLHEELQARPWLSIIELRWDPARRRIVATIQMDGEDPAVEGGVGGAIFDNVWDCVFATMPNNSSDWAFDVEESTRVAAV